jgi:hypothetical protein
MKYASPRVVLLVAALFSFKPVHAAMSGAMAPDEAGLRVMISLAVAWVLVGVLTGVSHAFLSEPKDKPPGPSSEDDQ